MSTRALLNASAPVGVAQRTMNVNKASAFMGAPVGTQRFMGLAAKPMNKSQQVSTGRSLTMQVNAVKDGTPLDRKLRVAVIGGGPSGACAAETLAQGGVEAFLIERKMDNCKVCCLISFHYPKLWSHLVSSLASLIFQK
jgi:geranylgeranyl diphosphate/geranylgeranyl-bacteriochlorophyllide a reductase